MHSAALRAGVFQVIEREAKTAKDAAKAELSGLPVGDTVAGRVGDEVLCKVAWSKGREKLVVTDERAFVEWVKLHHPTEIVESVNPAYTAGLARVGQVAVDADGVVVDGVEVVAGEPFLSVRSEKAALGLVERLVSEGRVSLSGVQQGELL